MTGSLHACIKVKPTPKTFFEIGPVNMHIQQVFPTINKKRATLLTIFNGSRGTLSLYLKYSL